VVMAAAVADFRPKAYAAAKIKKTHAATVDGGPDESAPTIELVRNPDILAGLVEDRGAADRPLIVGFAAETGGGAGSVLDLARAKLARKGCDLLVVNDVRGGAVFGAEENQAVILGADGSAREVPTGTKAALAHAVWDEVAGRLGPAETG